MFPLLLVMAATIAPAPKPAAIAFGQDHYFGADAYDSATYLHLRPWGRYEVVDVQHMFNRVMDEGRWFSRPHGVVLESERDERDIQVGDFNIYLVGACGRETLPELRAAIAAIGKRGEQVLPREIENLQAERVAHPSGHGPRHLCFAAVGFSAYNHPEGYLVPVADLDLLLQRIDAWLAEAATQNQFEYSAWEYRGEQFLVPMRPGMTPVDTSLQWVHKEMDDNAGRRAPYVYYAIPAHEFDKRSRCTYAFKFHPGMNKPCNHD